MLASQFFEWPDEIPFKEYFDLEAEPWSWIPNIKKALAGFDFEEANKLGGHQSIPPQVFVDENVFIHRTAKLAPCAVIHGPAWIGPGTEIRPNAYIRGNVIIGANCVIGNSCEYKNCMLLNGVESPHYNYVGDSILGNKAHLGAGAILANLRLDRSNVPVKSETGQIDSGLRKFGAILGDGAEALCNSVLQPGTVLGKKSVVMSGVAYGGTLASGKILVVKQEYREIRRR